MELIKDIFYIMSLYFINLAIRFCLEITALIAVGMYGWHQSDSWLRYVYATGLPLLLSVIWGVFNVPGDPSRGGSAPVPVPGFVRLIIEAAFFACGAYALISLGYATAGWIFTVVIIVHYLASFNRVLWILSNRSQNSE